MTVTRQDAITFAIGLGAALAIQLGTALVQLDGNQVTDWGQWALSLATGLAAAGGRYVVTALTQRGLAPDVEPAQEAATREQRLDRIDLMRGLAPMESRSVIKS